MSQKSIARKFLDSSAIIPTLNRPERIRELLKNLSIMPSVPSRIIIVDASEDQGLATSSLTKKYSNELRIEVKVSTVKGIPYQRNLGLSSNKNTIVHFLDDDIELSNRYFEEIELAFKSAPNVVGVCGLVTNTKKESPSFVSRFFLLTPKPGKISKAGHNAWMTKEDVKTDFQAIEWLTGPCMSYNFNLLKEIRFDERFPGYSLGEDMRFSYECSKIGDLVIAKNAKLQHFEMNTEKSRLTDFIECKWSHQRFFVLGNPEKFNFSYFLFSFYGSVLISIFKVFSRKITFNIFMKIIKAKWRLIWAGINSRKETIICKCAT